MRKELLAAAAAAAIFVPTFGQAQTVIEHGARAGETVGSAVGGAVGAAVSIPGAVVDFVTGQRGHSVVVEERVVVGEPLPRMVELRPIPDHHEYSYAIVNERRVIVEPRTRRVVRIID